MNYKEEAYKLANKFKQDAEEKEKEKAEEKKRLDDEAYANYVEIDKLFRQFDQTMSIYGNPFRYESLAGTKVGRLYEGSRLAYVYEVQVLFKNIGYVEMVLTGSLLDVQPIRDVNLQSFINTFILHIAHHLKV